MKKVVLLSKAFLSVWIVYNIFVMLIMPNVGAYFGRVTEKFVTHYASTVGLNAGWNFFSPEPAQPMYLKYRVNYRASAPDLSVDEEIEPQSQSQSDRTDSDSLAATEALLMQNLGAPKDENDIDDEYQIRQDILDSIGVGESVDYHYPPEVYEDGTWGIIQKREWALMRYMILDPKRLRILMGPWLCKKHPGAESIEMEHVISFIPFLDQAVKFKSESVEEMAKRMNVIKESVSCDSQADEESLW